jgi:hypothetical protein
MEDLANKKSLKNEQQEYKDEADSISDKSTKESSSQKSSHTSKRTEEFEFSSSELLILFLFNL